MIKLVASDLDGTLLQNGSKVLEPEIFPLIRKLKEKGILFVAASGRQYASLRHLFHEVADDIGYICENGALVMYQDQVFDCVSMEDSLKEELIKEIQHYEGCDAMYSTKDACYIEEGNDDFFHYLKDIVKNNVHVVKDLLEIKEPCIKLSIYRKEGITKEIEEHFQKVCNGRVFPASSGLAWLDMLLPNANKGTGICALMEHLHITKEECMAFGDQANDIAMLESVSHSYAMENGVDRVKEVSRYRCYRVEDTIKEVFGLEE